MTIGSSVTAIGNGAFDSCSSLPGVTIPDSVTSIGASAFNSCYALTSMTIPDSVTSIGDGAFAYCEALTEICVDENNACYSSDSQGVLFNKDKSELILAPGGYQGHYSIPGTVTRIGDYAFKNCGKLTGVTIPDSVTSIGDGAFASCNSLSEIFFCGDAPSIELDAFSIVTATAYYPADNTTWTSDVMQNYWGIITWIPTGSEGDGEIIDSGVCGKKVTWTLTDKGVLTISGTGRMTNYTDFADVYNEAPWYRGGNFVKRVVIEDGVTSIGESAFAYCNALTSVTIPDSVTSIGLCAFQACDALTDVTIPDSVTSIGTCAFEDCDALTEITIPDSVTSIGTCAFARCDSLNKIYVSENSACYSIDSYGVLFNKDKTLLIQAPGAYQGHYTIPDSVTHIETYSFDFCNDLTSVTFGKNVINNGGTNFQGCKALVAFYVKEDNTCYSNDSHGVLFNKDKTELIQAPDAYQGHYTIPDTVTFISWDAFSNCDALTGVTIPDSVTYIAGGAFYGCDALTSITIPDSISSINSGVFSNCHALTSVTIPDSVTQIGNGAFAYCGALTNVPIPDSVTYIDNLAFVNCYSLSDVTIPDGVTYIGFYAFSNCYSLSNVTIPSSVTYIGSEAFDSCQALTEIIFQGESPSIGDIPFREVTATAYYPVDHDTWTSDVMKSYGGKITWVPYGIKAPKISVSNVKSTGKIEVSWEAVDGAVEYQVYCASSKNGTYSLVETTTNVSYTHTGAVAGETYYYYVVAVDDNGEKSSKSNIVSRTCDLPQPEISVSNVASTGKIKVSWEAIDGAVEYEVYRATAKDGTYDLMKTTTGTSYTNTGAKAGETYYYKVIARASKSSADSAYSEIKSRTCDMPQPEITVSNVASSGKIKVSWEAIDGAVEYEVYRAASKDGTYTLVNTTTNTSCTDTGAVAGNTYYYKVVARASKSAANSAASEVKSRTCDLPRPKISVSNVASSGKIKVSWEAIDGAAKYEVYRATSKDGTYTLVKTTTGTSYTNSGAKAGETYYYKVKALASKSAADSAYSEVKSRTCDLAQPTASVALKSGKPKVSWNAVDGAVEYEVYRATSKDGTYTLVKTTTGTSYTNTGAKAGNTYYYKVIAIASTSAANSAYSSVVSIKSN